MNLELKKDIRRQEICENPINLWIKLPDFLPR